ncbi:coiled-coil domain-containing protein 22 homolog [Uranotaenia lowii]|uniref:coiled-coil domain-containing protein 22 homolog n=1 Tax=Uranotaenia lowii TaxID=190385 RepID=UPI00247A8DFB|nr:coiled-coil domain-containing protein 22 homolog [Uranotaenia lowii]
MDEIDNIIFHSLKQIECNLDEEITGLTDLDPSLLVKVVSKCISLIEPSLDPPKKLPPGMAQRFTVTASLAEACRSVGYRRDIGYQTFLYPNVTEVRRMLMFLIERLPKETSGSGTASGEPLDGTSKQEQRILANLQNQLHAPWMPEFCRLGAMENTSSGTSETGGMSSQAQIAFRRFLPRKVTVPFVTQSDVVSEIKEFWARMPLDGLDKDSLVPSMIAANDGALKSSTSSIDEVDRQSVGQAMRSSKLLAFHAESAGEDSMRLRSPIEDPSLGNSPLKSNESKPVYISKSPLETLQEEIEVIRIEIDREAQQNVELEDNHKQLEETLQLYLEETKKLKDEKRLKERTHILLEDPEVNLKKLESIIAAGGDRMRKLQDQWDTHRIPLVETLEAHRVKNSDKFSKSQQVQNQIDATRQKCEEVVSDLQSKSALHARLQQEFEKLNKTVSRNAYTSRILEIIGNIRKQKTDIDNILQDTRTLQKDINNITGQLDRQFTVTDDLIFRNAKRDEHSKRAYKLLVTLHSDCAELIGLVQETGSIKREIRDIEDQIENEKSRNTAANLEQITRDLAEMQQESERLEATLKNLERH